MSRVQLALNVADIDAAIDFYTKLFETPPAKVRDGYANFVITEPPLKLVLFAGQGDPGTLNHIGVEVESTDEVSATAARVAAEGMAHTVQNETTCCYATQDKVWVHGPDNAWEIYTVLADAPVLEDQAGACCADQESSEAPAGASANACC